MEDRFSEAILLFGFAAVTDFLDGYIARNWKGQKSHLGAVIDPLADKILVTTLLVVLALKNWTEPSLVCLIFARDFSLIFGGMWHRFR